MCLWACQLSCEITALLLREGAGRWYLIFTGSLYLGPPEVLPAKSALQFHAMKQSIQCKQLTPTHTLINSLAT